MKLPTGKVGPYELAEMVFPKLKLKDERVLVGPGVGVDASVIDLGEEALILSSDPITGALSDPGWLSVNVNANDVAVMGASPEWFLATLFLPEGSERSAVEEVMESALEACEELDISIVGGHTEVTPGLDRLMISGAMAGLAPADGWVSAAGAEPGDRILFTKSAAVEGTFILAQDRGDELEGELGSGLVERAAQFRDKLSVVNEALTAMEAGGVHAMHDPTEGGLAGGLHELADASEVGFSVESGKVPVAPETREICSYFGIDPIRTIGSGSLLICADPERSDEILKSLEDEEIQASEIGKVLQDEGERSIDGKDLDPPQQDELWKIFQ